MSWEASCSDVFRRCCDPSSKVIADAVAGDLPPRSDDACVDGEAGMTPGVPMDAAAAAAAAATPPLPAPTERAGEGAAAAEPAEPSVSIVKCGRLALLRLGVATLAESPMLYSIDGSVERCS